MESANSPKIVEAEIEIFGRVQGVLFRKAIRKFCIKHGIKGLVRNRADGSVLINAQGAENEIRNLIAWVKSSPGFVRVLEANVSYSDELKNYNGFEVIQEGSLIADKSKALFNLGKKLLGIGNGKIPQHVVIIPDGNRRWAREKGLNASEGHNKAGAYGNLEILLNEAKKIGVKYVSIWAFSTENWDRNPKEIKVIFDLLIKGVAKFRQDAHKNKIRFRHIGRKDRMPKKLSVELGKLEDETAQYNDFNVQLCLDYGGRDEIVRAVNKIIKDKNKKVDEEIVASYLDSSGIPDPDMIIRTSGENRISGFMPFQAVYSELYFTEKYFPDFGAADLRKAVEEYGRRVRRFGGTAKEDLMKKDDKGK